MRKKGHDTRQAAKGRPSHIGRAILGRSTCIMNHLLQDVDGQLHGAEKEKHACAASGKVFSSNLKPLKIRSGRCLDLCQAPHQTTKILEEVSRSIT